MAKGLWEQWGPRMQSILEQTVKTLHEANEQVEAEQQYTILDGLKLLSDDPFRKDVLKKVSDPYLLEWWARDFGSWHRQYKAEALAPVQTRLSYYASSKRARAILGQRRSTIDLRRTILEGGVLLVSTSQGTVGRDVAALVGASLLNLVDAVIREQGGLPLEQAARRAGRRRRDAVDARRGLRKHVVELGKFGASFVLATQSLAKLDDLSRTMRDTLLANVGCLAVFQVAGNDARTLVWELGKDRVTEDDITSLPVHHCYVRATVGTERMPAFSMMVRKPEDGDPETPPASARRPPPTPSRPGRRTTPTPTATGRWATTARASKTSKRPGAEEAGEGKRTRTAGSRPVSARRTGGRRRDEAGEAAEEKGGRGMRPEGCEADLLRALASMPFLDRQEMVAVSGWSRAAVYEAVQKLEAGGFCASVLHAGPASPGAEVPPHRRRAAQARRGRGQRPSTSWCAPAPSPPSGGAA